MNATMASTFRRMRDIEDTSAHKLVTRATHGLVGCRRCGGMLVDEHCMDIGEGGSGHRFWGMRCIQCGDIIDETILRNRYAHAQTLNKPRSRTRLRAIVQALAGPMRKGGSLEEHPANRVPASTLIFW